MPALTKRRSVQIKRQMLSEFKKTPSTRNFFGKRRKKYMLSVVNDNLAYAEEIENSVISMLKSEESLEKSFFQDENSVRLFRDYLRLGVPLPNALNIALLTHRRKNVKNPFLERNPRYRKPEVLRAEMEINELEYESLRLGRNNAIKFGLTNYAEMLAGKMESKGRTIAAYKKVFKERLVQE